jgi:GNAT superfamily N-acetyltransferase
MCRCDFPPYRREIKYLTLNHDVSVEILHLDGNSGEMGWTMFSVLENEVRLSELIIVARYRNRGYGSYLVKTVQLVAAFSKKPITLFTHLGAKAFFEKLGFVVTKETDSGFEMSWIPKSLLRPKT